MTKQLWLTDDPATTHRGDNTAKLNAAASWWTPLLLSEARGNTTGTTVTATCTTVAGTTNGVELGPSTAPYEWLSEPLSTDFTISGTISVALWAAESSTSANVAINFLVEKIDGATGALTQITKSVRVTELTTSAASVTFTATPTSTACKRGDRLRVRVFADDAGTMGTGFTVTLWFDRSTNAQGESWIQFNETLTFEPSGNPGWKFQLNEIGGGFPVGNTSLSEAAQPFVAGGPLLTQVSAWLHKFGAPTDNVIVTVETDSGGFPSGTVVGTVATVAGTSMTTAPTQFTWSGLSIVLTPGVTYHLRFVRSGALDSGIHYQVAGADTTIAGWSNSSSYLVGIGWNANAFPLAVGLFYPPSTYYLTDTAETINPGAAIEKKALTTRGSGSVNAVTNTAAGPTAGIQTTNSAGGTVIEWYTAPLEAITLGGKAKFNIRALESNLAANASLKAEIAVVSNTGTSPVVWGVADIQADTATRGELTASDAVYFAWVSGDDVAITAGQRLRFRVYVDDVAIGPLVTGNTVTVSYNGTSASAAGDTYVILPVAVIEQVTAVSKSVRAKHIPSIPVIRAATR